MGTDKNNTLVEGGRARQGPSQKFLAGKGAGPALQTAAHACEWHAAARRSSLLSVAGALTLHPIVT